MCYYPYTIVCRTDVDNTRHLLVYNAAKFALFMVETSACVLSLCNRKGHQTFRQGCKRL